VRKKRKGRRKERKGRVKGRTRGRRASERSLRKGGVVLHLKKEWKRYLAQNADGLSSDTLQTSSVPRMPRRIVDGLAKATPHRRRSREYHAASLTVPRMPYHYVDGLSNDTLFYADSAGGRQRQRRRQRQTSDSLTPTLRNWENTRSARV